MIVRPLRKLEGLFFAQKQHILVLISIFASLYTNYE